MNCPECGSEMREIMEHDEPKGLPWAHANIISIWHCWECGYERNVSDSDSEMDKSGGQP